MIALLITATTPHGIVLSRPWGVSFDGLLASVIWHRRKWAAREAGEDFAYQADGPQESLSLPLARCGDPDHDADWHWMATFADLHPNIPAVREPDIRWRTSRTDHQRLQQLAPVISRQISDTHGRYQRRITPVLARPASHVTWRAVGDPEAIRELLADRHLTSIGKNTGTGEGVVNRWEVTETPDVDDWSAGHEHEPGVLGRSAPPRCLQGVTIDTGPLGTGALRPPYPHRASRAEAFQPAR